MAKKIILKSQDSTLVMEINLLQFSRLWGLNNAHQQISIDFTIKSTGFTNRIRNAPPYNTTRLYSSPSYFYLLTLFSLEKGNHTPSQKHIWKKKKKFWRAIYSQFHQNSTFAWRHTKKSETLLFSNIYSKWDCSFGLNKMLWSAICTFCQKMTDGAKHTSTLRRFAIKGESSCLFTYRSWIVESKTIFWYQFAW